MKRNVFLLFFVLLAFASSGMAQTGLFTYNGGYFIKNGETWYEYRPGDKAGVWAEYTQYGEEENFYNIENDLNVVSIPKNSSSKFYVASKGGEWKPIYTARNFYNIFTDDGRDIYCYNGGYFVRNGNKWKEYRPKDKQSVWSSYTQYRADDDFFYIESSANKVAIPRTKDISSNIYLYKNDEWKAIYTVSDIYESKSNGYYAGSGNSGNSSSHQQNYDFTLTFPSYEIWDDKEESYGNTINSSCSVSISRKGYGLISYGSKKVEFKFNSCIEYEKRNDVTSSRTSADLGLLGVLFLGALDIPNYQGFTLYENINADKEIVTYVDPDLDNLDSTEENETILYIEGIPGIPDMRFLKCSNRRTGKKIHDTIENQNFFDND